MMDGLYDLFQMDVRSWIAFFVLTIAIIIGIGKLNCETYVCGTPYKLMLSSISIALTFSFIRYNITLKGRG